MSKNPYINALAASAYIVVVALMMYFGSQHLEQGGPSVLIPIAMLSLLVLSVSVMAYLFFYQPAQLIIAGRAAEAGTFFLKSVALFAVLTFFFLMLLYFVPRAEVPREPGNGTVVSADGR